MQQNKVSQIGIGMPVSQSFKNEAYFKKDYFSNKN